MSHPRTGPSRDVVVEALHYDQSTGEFTRRNGLPAGTVNRGYLRIRVSGVRYPAHRLAWLIVFGEWPPDLIDHIDSNRLNNAIANLRLATYSQNATNRARSKTARPRGVQYRVDTGRYQATIVLNGKRRSLGYYDCADEAATAYQRAALVLHGEFARLD